MYPFKIMEGLICSKCFDLLSKNPIYKIDKLENDSLSNCTKIRHGF